MASSTPDLLEQLISGEPFFFLSTAQKTFNKKVERKQQINVLKNVILSQ
jgi:hypothetical protein